jgi:hypothetical protein
VFDFFLLPASKRQNLIEAMKTPALIALAALLLAAPASAFSIEALACGGHLIMVDTETGQMLRGPYETLIDETTLKVSRRWTTFGRFVWDAMTGTAKLGRHECRPAD